MRVTEHKRKLDGRVLRYACDGVRLVPGREAVLRYRPPGALDLAGVAIPAGATSFGLFWADRPYNIYHWVDAAGDTLAYYCNVATETRIEPAAVRWLDLEADVLVTPDGRVRVLDLDEVPADLAPAHRQALESALATLGAPAEVLREVERAAEAYRRRGG